MQRPMRQGMTGLKKPKGLDWRDSVDSTNFIEGRRNTGIADFETRLEITETTNKQILGDLSAIKRKLQGMNGDDASLAELDSETSLFQVPSKSKGSSKQSRNLAATDIRDISSRLGHTNKMLEKVSADLQTINSRCGSQGVDILNLYQELKNVDSKFENKLSSERDDRAESIPSNNPFLRNSAVMAKTLEQLQVSIGKLEIQVEQNVSERLRFENNVHSSISELSNRLSETEKSTRQSLGDLQSEVRDNAQELVSLRQSVWSEFENKMSKLNSRILTELKKMQDNILANKTEIDAALHRFTMMPNSAEKEVAELESYVKKMEKGLASDVADIREDQRATQKRLLGSLSQLDLAVEALEQGLSDEKEQLRGVVAAEIKARTSNISSMQSGLQDLEKKVSDTASKVDSVVGDLQTKVARLDDDIHSLGVPGSGAGSNRNLNEKIAQLEDNITELRESGQQESQEVQENLSNVAEAVQAVKAALLKKMETIEKETSEALEKLDADISELNKKRTRKPASSNEED